MPFGIIQSYLEHPYFLHCTWIGLHGVNAEQVVFQRIFLANNVNIHMSVLQNVKIEGNIFGLLVWPLN